MLAESSRMPQVNEVALRVSLVTTESSCARPGKASKQGPLDSSGQKYKAQTVELSRFLELTTSVCANQVLKGQSEAAQLQKLSLPPEHS